MKQISHSIFVLFVNLLFFLMLLYSPNITAQQDDKLILLEVPSDFRIKDKIKLVNKSTCTILRAVVVLADVEDQQVVLGTCNIVEPEGYITLADFERNGLRALRGRTIGIKVKGYSKMLIDQKGTAIGGFSGGTGGVVIGIRSVDIKAEDINNLPEEYITYDFSATISEANHDLYIKIYDKGNGSGVLDF